MILLADNVAIRDEEDLLAGITVLVKVLVEIETAGALVADVILRHRISGNGN